MDVHQIDAVIDYDAPYIPAVLQNKPKAAPRIYVQSRARQPVNDYIPGSMPLASLRQDNDHSIAHLRQTVYDRRRLDFKPPLPSQIKRED